MALLTIRRTLTLLVHHEFVPAGLVGGGAYLVDKTRTRLGACLILEGNVLASHRPSFSLLRVCHEGNSLLFLPNPRLKTEELAGHRLKLLKPGA